MRTRLIDAAHAGETIVVAQGGKPWARLVPLEPPLALLLEPLPAEELAAMEQPLL